MVDLQKRGCHNINFVTPSHVVQPILKALPIAVEKGLDVARLSIIAADMSAFRRSELVDGIVDIYMPDFKFWGSGAAIELCSAPDYPARARARAFGRCTGKWETWSSMRAEWLKGAFWCGIWSCPAALPERLKLSIS